MGVSGANSPCFFPASIGRLWPHHDLIIAAARACGVLRLAGCHKKSKNSQAVPEGNWKNPKVVFASRLTRRPNPILGYLSVVSKTPCFSSFCFHASVHSLLLHAKLRVFFCIHEPVRFSAYSCRNLHKYCCLWNNMRGSGRPRDAWLPVSHMLEHMLTCPSTRCMVTCVHAGTYVNVPVHALHGHLRTCWHIC